MFHASSRGTGDCCEAGAEPHVGALLAKVLPLALGAAVSPTVLAMQGVTLASSIAPLRRAWAIATGYLLVLLAEAGIVLAFAAGTGGSSTPSSTASYVKLGAAVLLIALGIRAVRRPRRTTHRSRRHPASRGSPATSRSGRVR